MFGEQKSPFIWGRGGKLTTPEAVARERLLAQMAQQRAGDTSPVGHWTQGAARVVDALAGRKREKRADEAESRLREEADQKWSEVVSALTGRSAPSHSGAPTPRIDKRTEADVIGDEAMAAIGRAPLSAEAIRQGLIERGLPEHVADGFVMNFRDESGLDPSINEIAPIVPGSRGGFGLAQWTGPRRRALEAFAASQGKPVSDPNVQMDFLVMELQGPESAAAQAILAAPDAGTAATEIVNRFLRPAEEHRVRRAAAYGGGASSGMSGVGQDMASLMAIGEALGNPYIAQDAGKSMVLQALLQRALTPPQQGYQTVMGQQLGFGGDLAGSYFNVSPDGRVSQIGGGGTSVTVNNAGAGPQPELLGTQGLVAIPDPSVPEGYRIVPAPGSPIAEERAQAEQDRQRAGETAATNEQTRSNVVSETVAEIRKMLDQGGFLDLPEVGVVGSRLRGVNQEAADMGGMLDTLKGMVVFDRLEKLRQASATGASGLGQVTEREIALLGAQLGALDQSLSKDRILQTMDTIEQVFSNLSPQAQAYLTGQSDALPAGGQAAPEADDVPTWNPQTGQWE